MAALAHTAQRSALRLLPATSEGRQELVIAHVGGHRLGFPLAQVERVFQATSVQLVVTAPESTMGVLPERGQLLPVLSLRRWLGLPPRALAPQDHMMVLRCGNARLVLVVDAVAELQSLDSAAISAACAALAEPVEDGVLPLGEDLRLVFDLPRLIAHIDDVPAQWARPRHRAAALSNRDAAR